MQKANWITVTLDGKSYLVRMERDFPVKAHQQRTQKGFGRDYLNQPAYKPLPKGEENLQQRIFGMAMMQAMLAGAKAQFHQAA